MMRSDWSQEATQAVKQFWRTREAQTSAQRERGKADAGARGAVTGGKQMSGFIQLFASVAQQGSAASIEIHRQRKLLVLPGFFRPSKEWDLLITHDGQLIAAIEAKSQVGSFGNNFNNRAEEAIGSAVDLWTAFREGAFGSSPAPFVGWMMHLEDCPASQTPVRVDEPHFAALPEFREASYAKRYELLCQKLVRERHYSATAFVLSDRRKGARGKYTEPNVEASLVRFIASLEAHVRSVVNE